MVRKIGEIALNFDIHFVLVNSPEEIVKFLHQFEVAELAHKKFYGQLKFQPIVDILEDYELLKGKEAAFQKELEGMFDEVRLEIIRRVRLMYAFQKQTNLINEDWQKIKVFKSLLLEMKQTGMFEMVTKLLEEAQINLGKRFSYDEKYKPFNPLLNGKAPKSHTKTIFKSVQNESLPTYSIWLNPLEYSKSFGLNNERKQYSGQIATVFQHLPEDLIYEKIIPKVITAHSFDFNVIKDCKEKFKEIFDLNQYVLAVED